MTSRVSPHVDAVERWLPGWLLRCGLPQDVVARLSVSGFAAYAARLRPAAPAAELRSVTAMLTWFFLVDDAVDGPATPAVRATVEAVRAALGGGPGLCPPMRRMLQAWWEPIPPAARPRLTDAIRHHLDGVLVEAANKRDGRHPGVAEYIHVRRATSGAYVLYGLTDLPDAVYHHPVLREASAAGNDLLSWFNDLMSLDRDAAASGGHNLVLATAHEHGIPMAAAVRSAVERWRTRKAGFEALAVPSFGPALDPAVRRYVEEVATSVRATVDWTLESPRYPVPTLVAPWLADLVG
jgi:hypothetical protein